MSTINEPPTCQLRKGYMSGLLRNFPPQRRAQGWEENRLGMYAFFPRAPLGKRLLVLVYWCPQIGRKLYAGVAGHL